MTDLSGTGVRVLLMGTATHRGAVLPPVPAARRTVTALERRLVDRCGVSPELLRVVLDPPDARTMAEAITREAERAEAVLVVYYVGHGLLGPGSELYLAAADTDMLVPGLAAHQALSVTAVREALDACPADTVVLVLDCCFSGRAGLGARAPEPVFTLPAVHGGYLLASAEHLALAPPEQEYTTFSGALIRLLDEGDPRGPRLLTLDDVYEYLTRTLRREGGPLPRRQAADRAGSLVVAPNPAQPPPRPPGPAPEQRDGRCPYAGLASFGVEDAALFRGRDRLVDELLDGAARALLAGRPLFLVGASGAGKSSLLHAGLLARLRAGAPALPGSAGWPAVVFTPGERPLRALAARLAPEETTEGEPPPDDPAYLAGLVRDLLATRGADRLVLVVDQLEELFVACPDREERAAFLRAVAALAGPEGAGGALVVLALRADFYGHAAAHPELVGALREHQLLVGPMSVDELRAAIEEPAAAVGLRLDDGLADVVLHELGATGATGPQAGALPLLSHALWATWLRRSAGRLTVAGYHESGGIAEAIARTADRTYAALDEAGQEAVRRMLPRLVRVDEDLNDTARAAGVEALRRGLPVEVAEPALRRLAEARLVTLDRDSVRLAHEVLLRAWPRLRDWVDADREWLRTHQRLGADARSWLRGGRDPSLLYRGSRLAAVSERVAEAGRTGELEPEVVEFLGRSAGQERRGVRLRRAVVAGLTALLVLATAGGATAVAFQRQASAQRAVALARLVASQAEEVRARHPGLAKQLSLVAYRMDPDAGAGPVLASQQSPGVFNAEEPVIDLAQSGDGRVLAISTGLAIALWDPDAGRPWARIRDLVTGPVALSADGRTLAAGAGRVDPEASQRSEAHFGEVRLWNVADPGHPVAAGVLPAGAGSVTTLALSGDGRILAAGTARGDVKTWDVADPHAPRPLATFTGHRGGVETVAFAPQGRLLATSGADSAVRLWDLAGRGRPRQLSTIAVSPSEPDRRLGRKAVQHRLAFTPNGRVLATVTGVDGREKLRLWGVENPARPRAAGAPAREIGEYPCERIHSIAFDPTASVMASNCDDGRFTLWWPLPGRPKDRNLVRAADMFARSGPGAASFHRSAGRLLQAGDDGVRLWDVTNPWQPGAVSTLPDAVGGFDAVATFNPVGRRLLAYGGAFRTQIHDIGDIRRPRYVTSYPGSGLGGNGVGFAPGGDLMAVSEAEGSQVVVRLRRTDDPRAAPVATLTDLANGVSELRFSPDRRTLAVLDNSDHVPSRTGPPAIRLYDVHDPSRPRHLAVLRGNMFSLSFSPDGRLLTGYASDAVLAWDLTDPGRPTPAFTYHLTPGSLVSEGKFTPDGRLLAVGDGTGTLRLWRIVDGRPVGEPVVIPGDGTRSALDFSPDGRTLAVESSTRAPAESSIELWRITDAGSVAPQARFTIGTASIDSLAFSPDGQLLATASAGSLDLWDTNPERVADAICRTTGDVISRADWARHVPDTPYDPPCD